MRGKIVGDEFGTRTLFCSNSMMNWKHFSYEDPFFFSSLVARRTLIIVELCAQLKHRKSIWLRAIYNKKKPKSLKCKENKGSFNTFIIVKFVWSNFSLALVIVFLLVEFEFFFRSEKKCVHASFWSRLVTGEKTFLTKTQLLFSGTSYCWTLKSFL